MGRPPGRPCKLTPDVAGKIVAHVRDGVPLRWAGQLAGVGMKTVFRWMADAEAAEEVAEKQGEEAVPEEMSKFRHFRQRILTARAELLAEAVAVKHRHALHKNPKVSGPASTFMLTHMFPGDFSPKTQVEATGKDGGPIAISGKVEHSGTVGLAPLVTLETLRALTRAENEAALAVELERQERAESEAEASRIGSEGGSDGDE